MNKMTTDENKLNESNELSQEDLDGTSYEMIGRILMREINMIYAENGNIVSTNFVEAILITSISLSRDAFIITPEVQPLYNIKNEYMGLLYYGKIRNIKKEKKIKKIKKNVSFGIAMLMAFIIGFKAPIIVAGAFVVFIVVWGYSNYISLAYNDYKYKR